MPTAIDLYCGVGGLSLGLVEAGFKLLGGADSDPQTLETHRQNFPGVRTSQSDLFTISGDDLRKSLAIQRQKIDLIAGGPPCQGFSSGGLRSRNDPRNQGIMAFARLVEELQPRYFVMENVRGFLFCDHYDLREQFVVTLRRAGYLVTDFQLLNASDYGVPQRRKRVFVFGCQKGEVLPDYPKRLPGLRPTVRSAIIDLQVLDTVLRDPESDVYEGELGPATSYSRRLRRSREGGRVKKLSGCLRTSHSDDVAHRFANTAPGSLEPISRFYRLNWSGISPTLRAGTGPDHGSHTAPRPIHPEFPRCITVREAARLHSFPDWFQFRGTRWHGFRQIGNSVPPLLASAVAKQVMQALIKGKRDD